MSKKRLLLHGSNALILTVVVLGILVFVNYFALKEGGRLDLTKEKLFSISDKTKKLVNGLDKEVEIIGFFKELGLDKKQFVDLTNQYKRNSDKIIIKLVDPDKSPGLTNKYEVTEYSTVVLATENDNLKIRLSDPLSEGILKNAEEEITNAIIKLSTDDKKTLYFISGHGERDINNANEVGGFGKLAKALQDEGYETSELIIKTELDLSNTNSILVLAGSKQPFIEAEIDAIKKYLDGGGSALFMFEPRGSSQIVSLLSEYGFSIGNNIVIDPSSKLVGGGDVAPIIAQYPSHKITDGFNFATMFPYARTVEKNSADISPIAMTSDYSWAETNLDLFDSGAADFDSNDSKGPLSIAAVGSLENGNKLAVFGSVEFASNRFLDFSGNKDLILNTVNWISGDENLISIRPKVAEQGKFILTSNQLTLFFVSTVVVIPLIIISIGITVWWKRKNM